MDINDTSESAIVDVVTEYDYYTQNEKYNEKFIKWHKDPDNQYAFNFRENLKESVFIDGKGFESKSSADEETKTVTRIMNVAGMAMLIWIVIDNILGKLIVSVFDLLGFDIHASFFSTAMQGGRVEIVTALVIITSAKIWIPSVFIRKRMKMPLRIEYMSTLNSASEMLRAIFMSMAVSAVTSLPNIYTNRTRQVYYFFKSINTDVSVWSQEQFVVYTLFDILIVSILTEMLFRGALFTALRQFGDIFAIIITASMAGLLVQDFRELPAAVMISAVAAVGMLRSGTLLTAIFVQMIYKMYNLSLILLEASSEDSIKLQRNAFILIVFVIGAAGVIMLHLLRIKKEQRHLVVFYSQISLKQRLSIALRSFPVPAVACICLLAAFIKLVF